MTPIILATVDQTRESVRAARRSGKRIGLVPTMGNLHEGHLSLIRAARKECDFIVVSIFVNPTQFGPNEDFERYPRTMEADVEHCRNEKVDVIFHPSPAVLYPKPYHTYVEVHDLQEVLCGVARPIHFRGVATVVVKLFNIVQPDVAFFGQKDAQQARIIEQFTRDLNLPVDVRIGPIVREADGLALSSRNQYLTAEQRRHANVLYETLCDAKIALESGTQTLAQVELTMVERIEATLGARPDYARIVDWETLQPVLKTNGRILIALAVYFGTTRLIDNVIVDLESRSGNLT